jgi:glycosyltransferase involved in cell wall biosynthesis
MEYLFVSYTGGLGGAERLLLELAAGLGEPPGLACPPGPLADAARAAGVGVKKLSKQGLDLRASAADQLAAPLRLAAQGRELRAVLDRTEPRCLVAWNMRGLLVASSALARRRARPALVFVHNDFLPGPVIAAAVRRAARRADRVICVSRAVAADLDPSDALGRRLEVIPPGVDLERYTAQPPADGDPEVLVLGALVPWKRPELALEAVALAAAELDGLRVTVAGAPLTGAGDELVATLEQRAAAPDLRGRVTFTGPLDDPRPALARAACLLHCADREPFGLVLVEAMASSRPVVAPAAAGPLEIVDRSCGRLFEPGNPRAAADALIEVLGAAGVVAGLGAAGRARAEAAFEIGRARSQFRELLAHTAPG